MGFRKKCLNILAFVVLVIITMIFALLEIIELIPALMVALITDKWPKFAWGITKFLYKITPEKEKDVPYWLFK